MEEEGFFGDFQRLSHRLGELQPYHHDVNAGSGQKLLEALHQVLAECVAASIKDGADDVAFPTDLAERAIPIGFKRCIGPCGRVLELNESNFRRDGKKHKQSPGFRGRCKLCLSVKRERDEKNEEAEQVPIDDQEVAASQIEAVAVNEDGEGKRARIDVAKGACEKCSEMSLHVCSDECNSKGLINVSLPTAVEGRELDHDGFKVYPKIFTVAPEIVERMCAYSEKGEEIFNNAQAGDESNDKLRKQVFFKSFIGKDEELLELQNRINLQLAELFQKRRAQDMVLLRSEPGCSAQRAHTDYTPHEISKARDDFVPLACVIALMDDTYFDVWPNAIRCFDTPPDGTTFEHLRLKLNAGDMLVFRGDLVHAGAAFSEVNVRIHTYLDVRGVKREENVTFYMYECDYILPRTVIHGQ